MRPKESHVRGATDIPLIEDTIGVAFDRAASRHGDREALVAVHQGVRWTYRQLRDRANSLAIGLLQLGLAPGDRVGIWAPNCAEWLLTQLATAKAGLILVNINPAYRRSELEYVLNKVGCKALILAPSFHLADYVEILRSIAPELDHSAPGELQAASVPELKFVIRLGSEMTPGMLNFDRLLQPRNPMEQQALYAIEARLRATDPVNIQFTSGTTGAPKGATLTHRNILNNGFFTGRALQLTATDRVCIPVPLYHCFGMVIGNLGCITHGATMVYPSAAFDAAAVLATIQAERCTAVHGVPTMFIALLAHPLFEEYDLSSLRTGVMGGSPCPVEVMKQVVQRMHMREVTIAYGMTETAPVSFQSSISDSVERRVSTVGCVQPHLEVKLIDEGGRTVPRGVTGELLTRGYSVMSGYWNDPEASARAIDADGWMHTGDVAVLDQLGYCNIVGRVKDLIIRGGENISPREIEEYLYRHPKIQAAAVFGVPDDRFGETVATWIKLVPGALATAEEIRAFCRGQIARFKIPQHIRFVEEFPMTVTGKIQKFVMRERMKAELRVEEAVTA
ncbi:MAG TPA: AMP-binding protein [Steroidobacteraceae bacterium]|jgi:fatty-acyl-CoA synthase|nr:AMP-binding protein [Steroidobacteraceae bacterium]